MNTREVWDICEGCGLGLSEIIFTHLTNLDSVYCAECYRSYWILKDETPLVDYTGKNLFSGF